MIIKVLMLIKLLSFLPDLNQDPYTLLTADDFAVILDSGCSIAMTNDESDFINGFLSVNHKICGIAARLTAQGVGNVVWTFCSRKGINVRIPLRCLYVPDLPTYLLLLHPK